MMCAEPVEIPLVPPGRGGGSRMLRGLMLRDVALLLINRLKKNIFLVNVPLKCLPPEAFFSPKYTKYRLAAGRALPGSALGELTAYQSCSSVLKRLELVDQLLRQTKKHSELVVQDLTQSLCVCLL